MSFSLALVHKEKRPAIAGLPIGPVESTSSQEQLGKNRQKPNVVPANMAKN